MCVHGGDTCVLILHGSMFLFVLSQAIAGPEKMVDRYEANAFYEFCLSSPEAHLVIVFSFKDTICDGHLDLVFEGLILARSFLIAIQIQIVIPSFTTDAMFLIVLYFHILQLTTNCSLNHLSFV